jgi:hypothetical protein
MITGNDLTSLKETLCLSKASLLALLFIIITVVCLLW